jgi:tetratricopeptide (TPR) repeat protein
VVVVGATIVAFLPALQAGFVNWDDRSNFLDNPAYRGLGLTQLAWMFTTFHMGPYQPLAWMTLGLDHLLWGMDARGYHLTSLLLHAATALGFYLVSLRLLGLALGGRVGARDLRIGAAAAALLFAIHPLRAESVAWVTERRDVLSGLFYVLTVLAWLRWAAPAPGEPPAGQAAEPAGCRQTRWYWAAVGLYAAALASKATTVTLLPVLVILDVYPLRRLGGTAGWRQGRVWLEKAPFALLAAAATVLAFVGISRASHLSPLTQMDIPFRIVLSVYGLAFYVLKSLWPLGLSPLYQLPVEVTWLHFALVIGASLAAVLLRRRWPALLAAWAAYVVTVLPVAGLFQNGPQVVADRYAYLGCLGLALLAGAAAAWRWRGRAAVRVLAAAWLLALGALTWQQAGVWRDSVSLWRHAVGVATASRAAHTNLANAYALERRIPEALAHYGVALDQSVYKAPYHMAMADLLEQAGSHGLALEHALAALRATPPHPGACAALARLARRIAVPPDATAACPGRN